MKLTGKQVFNQLNVLLAILLCSVLVLAMPVTASATASFQNKTQLDVSDHTAENQLILFAGEVTSGEPEAVLQLDRSLLTPILQVFLHQLYPQEQNTAPSPHSFPASKGDCGLHTILTKGP